MTTTARSIETAIMWRNRHEQETNYTDVYNVLSGFSIRMVQLGTNVYRNHSNVTKFTIAYLENVYHIDGNSYMRGSGKLHLGYLNSLNCVMSKWGLHQIWWLIIHRKKWQFTIEYFRIHWTVYCDIWMLPQINSRMVFGTKAQSGDCTRSNWLIIHGMKWQEIIK